MTRWIYEGSRSRSPRGHLRTRSTCCTHRPRPAGAPAALAHDPRPGRPPAGQRRLVPPVAGLRPRPIHPYRRRGRAGRSRRHGRSSRVSRRHADAGARAAPPGQARPPARSRAASPRDLRRPELAHTLPGGRDPDRVLLGPGPATSAAAADLAVTGRHRLEILAEGPRRTGGHGQLPRRSSGSPSEGAVAAEPEAPRGREAGPGAGPPPRAHRSRPGRSRPRRPRRSDPELSRGRARAYSEDMRENGHRRPRVSHDGEPRRNGWLRAGIVTDLAAENIGQRL
ncbi:MAG: hypothetical protein MZU79_07320 [Anaerotruncus sp.]|nr:hypothetical protein [Anaerotruncus sp.]